MFFRLLCLCLALSLSATAGQLRLATTTSVENSGLLAYLLPDFEKQCYCTVHVIPVGSGKALALARRGDVDVLITHAPKDEEEFVRAGYGIDKYAFMYNSFVLLGAEDEAEDIGNSGDILSTMMRISEKQLKFISRGDYSGTHKKEMELWQHLMNTTGKQIDFSESWYVSAGIGMGQAIMMANELSAYVISDIGTYLHFHDKVVLDIIVRNDPPLKNIYSVMRVNPKKHPHINSQLSNLFVDWLGKKETLSKIARYKINGEVLFSPISRTGS